MAQKVMKLLVVCVCVFTMLHPKGILTISADYLQE